MLSHFILAQAIRCFASPKAQRGSSLIDNFHKMTSVLDLFFLCLETLLTESDFNSNLKDFKRHIESGKYEVGPLVIKSFRQRADCEKLPFLISDKQKPSSYSLVCC